MSRKRGNVYKCEVCGNIVEVMYAGGGVLVCCGKPMVLQEENTVDASKEKHVPVIEMVEGGVKVSVGSVPHPMEEKHYIQWIEIIDEECGFIERKYLKPGDKPEAFFTLNPNCCTSKCKIYAREYCNLHGHWKKEVE